MQAQVTANFVASSVHVCQGDTIDFTNLSTGAISYVWGENGIPFATSTNASRTFNTPGTYVISLLATDGFNNDTTSTLVLVNPSLSGSITGVNASCNGFTDGSVDLSPVGGTPNLSLCFDGVNDYVEADSISTSNFSGGITIEGWIQPSTVWNTNDGMVVAFNTSGGANHFLLSYNRNLQRFIYFDDVVGNQQQSGNSPLGQWAHLALTISSSNQGRMYINGALVRSFTTGTSWIPNGGRCSIGQEYDGASTSQHFNGCMDEVRIWNTALTQTTIIDNYNNSCGSIDPNHPNINSLLAYYSFNEGSGTFIYDRSGNDNHGTFNGITWGLPINNNYGCFNEGTGYAYDWTSGDSTEDLSGIGAGSYAVTITDGAGCQYEDSITITEPPAIVYSITTVPGDTICDGDTTAVSASGGYTFTYSPGTGLSATTGANIDAFPTTTTTYEVVATDVNNCTDTSDFTITVNPLPTPSVSGVDTICFGENTLLTAAGGTSYVWNTGATTDTVTVMPTADSTFMVTATDANGCSADANYAVVVNPLPVVTFSGDTAICIGDTANITAAGGTSYTWSSGDNTATTTVAPTVTTTYSVVVVDNNFCQSIDSVSLTVNALPTVTITGNTTICDGDTTTLTASGGTSYDWSTGDMTAAITVGPSANTTYTVNVQDGNGCEASDSIAVTVNPSPTVSIAVIGSDTICANDSITLDATGAGSYAWSTGDSTSSISDAPGMTTIYTVTGTDANGCSGSATQEIVVNPLPVVTIAGQDTICEGDTTMLIASGAQSYVWNIGDTTAAIDVAPATSTTYAVTATDGNGCDAATTITVEVIAVPNPTVNDNGNGNLNTQSGFATYQWFLNGNPISGANSDSLVATQNGNYSVQVTNAFGCVATSPGVDVNIIAIDVSDIFTSLQIFPNPNQGRFTVRLTMDKARALQVKVTNLVGQQVFQHNSGTITRSWDHEFDLSQMAKGMYLLELEADGQRSLHRIVVD